MSILHVPACQPSVAVGCALSCGAKTTSPACAGTAKSAPSRRASTTATAPRTLIPPGLYPADRSVNPLALPKNRFKVFLPKSSRYRYPADVLPENNDLNQQFWVI